MQYTVKQLNDLYAAFAALDGQTHVLKDEAAKTEKAVLVPYKFGGKTRYTIGKNLAILKRHNEAFVKARDGLILELSEGSGTIDDANTALIGRLNKELQDLMSQEEDGSNLFLLSEKDLNLDENPIPGSVLAILLTLIKD